MNQLSSAGGCSDPNGMGFVSAGDGLLMRRYRSNAGHGLSRLCFYIPSDSQEGVDFAKRVLHSYHVDSGCLNARYVRWVFSRAFYVKGLRKLALEVCRSCDKCQFAQNRRYYSLRDGGRNLSNGVNGCWEVVSADLAEMGPDRKGTYTSALFLIDHFSRFALVAPLRSSSSSSVIGALSTFIGIFGPMGQLRSDCGPCFRGRKFTEYLASQGVVHHALPPYAAFSNGLVERSISAIKFITRQLASKRSWSSQIHRVLARLNAKPIDGIGLSPHEIFFARPRRFPVDNALHDVNSGALVPADEEQARQRREDGDYVDRLVSEALNASNSASAVKRFPRRGPPKVGSEVLVFVPNPMGGGSYGHEVYRVHRVLGKVTLQLVKSNVPPASVTPDIIKEVHYFNARPYYRSSGGHVSANQ
ncbi:retrovirus polyprotein, putative [Perkinsus marinus ATCC 50983]|uniref:Retrovirus polyprotein, putative n=1 Tax=Perkinsus marinus (strain ATCC 50983 / TXsc) TaxID=423536 RepID=C5K5M1_PERM5|nr:retrovirus polyprotein, putative [Perkinsus marinus ATCC 50983]EER20222.1 retrovirus polyprotein, putative [Perkinsus marinus ATCC 50983]|eukprot:XP_002788426.1 retrovirus polyprotein, putative [Perkinsus marinus ATCC 50983]